MKMISQTRPIKKFAKAVASCSVEALAYGKCVIADFNTIHKNKCLNEFLRLKNCYIHASTKL